MPEPLTPGGDAPAAPPPAPDSSAAAPPPSLQEPAARAPSELRALLFAALVLAVGFGLGAAGFFMEQATAYWRPDVTRTQAGWSIGPHGRTPLSGLALGGHVVAWQQGPSVVLMDLRSGRPLLLGPSSAAQLTWQPAAGQRYVVWFEAVRTLTGRAETWSYDTATRRRQQVSAAGEVLSYVSVSGGRAAWCTTLGGGTPQIVVVDLNTGARSTVAEEYGTPVVDGNLVAWAQTAGGGAPSSFTLVDVTDMHRWTILPAQLSRATGLTGFDLSGRTLVWGQSGSASSPGHVVAQNVDSGGVATVTDGVAGTLTAPSIDGDLVVWAEQDAGGSAYRVMGRRLSTGEPFQIARADGQVVTTLVSGTTVAWLAQASGADGTTRIQTATVPR